MDQETINKSFDPFFTTKGPPKGERLPDRRCWQVMDHASSYYRAEARHARELAETTWQPALEDTLRRVAREFDEAAENIESGVADAP